MRTRHKITANERSRLNENFKLIFQRVRLEHTEKITFFAVFIVKCDAEI